MEAFDKKYVRLAAAFAALMLLCGMLCAHFLWILIDIEDHVWAQVTFAASVLMYLVGAFSLNALVIVFRYGFICAGKRIIGSISAFVQLVLRSILTFGNVCLLYFCFAYGIIGSHGALAECLCTLLFLAVMAGGYWILYWLAHELRKACAAHK